MKTVFRTLIFAGLAGIMASCGSSASKQTAAPVQEEEVVYTVKVADVTSRDVPQKNNYSSTILAKVTNNIAPQAPGRIQKINVEVGDYVRAGQILAEMDKVNLEQAKLKFANDSIELGRVRGLYEQGGVSKSDLDAMELGYNVTRTQYKNLLENTILRSPISGVVTERNYDRGDLYSGARPIFVVQQITPVKFYVGISESEYTHVKKGDKVTLHVDAIPGETFSGVISRLDPTLNPATHTFNAEVVVANADRRLRPGMYARVEIVYGNSHNPVIPDDAVLKQEGSGLRYVYLLQDDNTVKLTPVKLGQHIGFEYEITEGLKDGDQLVVKGHLSLKNGVKVQVAE